MLIDTHCHLDRSYFPEGPNDVLQRAQLAGVGGFVVIGVGRTLDAARDAVALAEQRDDVMATVGVHPHDAEAADEAMMDELTALATRPRVAAIGEVGLDYYYEHSAKETQQAVLRRFIALAKAVRKPLVIHTRSAADDTLAVLRDEGAHDVGGVIHCFSEDLPFARQALDLGFDLSFSGIVTFKKSIQIQEVAAWAPADRILVETDSPYLAPVPLRGKPCEPAYVVHTARKIADLRGVSIELLSEQTTANAQRRFGQNDTAFSQLLGEKC